MTAGLLRAALLLAGLLAGTQADAARHPRPRQPAPDPQGQLHQSEQAREASLQAERAAADQARAAQAHAARLAAQQVSAAARLHQTEAGLAEAAARVDALQRRRADMAARLAGQGQALAPMLPLAVRLARFPAEAVLAASSDPQQAVRGLLVLRGLTRQLDTEAAAMRAGQAEAAKLSGTLSAELVALRATQDDQARQAQDLDKQIANTRALRRAAEDAGADAARRAAAEAARADSLRGVLARIEAEQRQQEQRQRQEAQREAQRADAQRREAAAPAAPPPASPVSNRTELAAASFSPPVAGPVVRVWGERGDAGPSSGMAFRAPPAARVVAPCPGRVVFSGPFRSFGPMVILDCGAGFHVVLAGLDRLDAQVGQPLQAGQPLGVMPGWDPRAGGARPALYLELRRGGQAVNPAPYLRGRL